MSLLRIGKSFTSPTTTPTVSVGKGKSQIGADDYEYKISFKTPFGETLPSPTSSIITVSTGQSIKVSNIELGPDRNVIARNIYRSSITGFRLVHTLKNPLATEWTDTINEDDITSNAQPVDISTAEPTFEMSGYFRFTEPKLNKFGKITALTGGTATTAPVLENEYNLVDTVGTIGDTVRLPLISPSLLGTVIVVRNSAANSCDILTSGTDDFEDGTADPFTLGAGTSVSFILSNYDEGTSVRSWSRV